jgi:lipoprotein-releasing system permease protein
VRASAVPFEFFVARRYLLAKRRQAVVSVITVVSVIGVAAGVMALIVALAINNGFRQTLQRLLLGATAHVSILEKKPGSGISDWRALIATMASRSGVRSATPALYGGVFFASPVQSSGGVLKGVQAPDEDLLPFLKEGSFDLDSGVVVGTKLARSAGLLLGSRVTIISPQGEMTPFGPRPSYFPMKVVGIFETGFYDLDSTWALTSLLNAQRVLASGDVVNSIELKLDDMQEAGAMAEAIESQLGSDLAASSWMEQNRPLLGALKTERTVTVVTIGLIQLVAALNILVTLTMMVMEKSRDIGVLMAMGATRRQVRRIFLWQGFLIGATGTAIGLLAGFAICHFAGANQWIQLDEQVYALGYLPFEARWTDAIWVAVTAIGVSLLATLHPARSATTIVPAEALRYE